MDLGSKLGDAPIRGPMAGFDLSSIAVLESGKIAELVRAQRYEEALTRLYEARDSSPSDSETYRAIQVVRDLLLRQGLQRLGSLDAVPQRVRAASGTLPSDEQYLFDLVRGAVSIDELLDASTLGRHRTVRGLVALVERGLVAMEKKRPAVNAPAPQVNESVGNRYVVVADGNMSAATLTRTMLRVAIGGGWSFETCGSAAQLIAAAEKQRPDLIVVEFSLPGSDGLAALRLVRKNSGVSIPSIVIAQKIEIGFVGARAPERAIVLARPIEKAGLLDALATLKVAGVRGRS
jgi:CheY-like chemotaxis protein